MQVLTKIIQSQKKELEQKLNERYLPRNCSAKVRKDDIIIIIGPRKAGKAFYGIHHLSQDSAMGFLSFENEYLKKHPNFEEILEVLTQVYPNFKTLILDEIQFLPNWISIANRLQRKGYQVILTASNANILNTEKWMQLSNRHVPIYLFTFSFNEYLDSFNHKLAESEKKEKFNDFIIQGGYPEPLTKSLNLNEYLQVLFDSIIYRDIVKRFHVRQAVILETLAIWLISNITGEYSMNYLSRQLQISSVHTVKKYMDYLEETYLFFSLSRFSLTETDLPRSNKKIYCFDNGIYFTKGQYTNNYKDSLFKNTVAAEIYKRCKTDGRRLYYWKGRDD
ncbi:ATP-binding protein, partial [Desulfosarcina sp.]|nr:ATP-binding protein [Desulfosarcina sp.]